MLKKYSQLLVAGLVFADCVVAALSWVLAYYLRFQTPLAEIGRSYKGGIQPYLAILPLVLVCSVIANRQFKLYEPKRIGYFGKEFIGILRAGLAMLVIFLAASFFLGYARRISFSRNFIAVFYILYVLLMALERGAARAILQQLRRKGKNLRHALVVGAGKIGQSMVSALKRNEWTGIKVRGFLDDRAERIGMEIGGIPVLASTDEVLSVIEREKIEQVFLCLPMSEYHRSEQIANRLEEAVVDVFMVPDLVSFVSLKSEVGNFEGLPVIHLRESPLGTLDLAAKRLMDLLFSGLFLLLISPVMISIALLVKLTSKGPVFYKQERMGLDGRTFQMLKFRSMKTDAEIATGAVWARENDPRRTAFGTFLRKTSLDELPQFINVLKGDMSVVGPRPERPVFIEEFKRTVPKYMLRHKMKAGITGWAQINGWRGNTSLKKRIQYDIYYIENWSLWFDLWIMILTAFRGLVNRNAY